MCCDRYKGAALTFIVRLLHSEQRNILNTGVPPSTLYSRHSSHMKWSCSKCQSPFIYILWIALIQFRCTMKNPDESWLCLSSCMYSSSGSSRQCQERHQIWESFYFVCFSATLSGHMGSCPVHHIYSNVALNWIPAWTDSCRGPLREQDTVWVTRPPLSPVI